MERGEFSKIYLDFVKKKGMGGLTRNQWVFAEFLLKNRKELIKPGAFSAIFSRVRSYLKNDYDWNTDKDLIKEEYLGYDIRVGQIFDYHETPTADPLPCKITNIMHDGHDVVYEFEYLDNTRVGATIYPNKLKKR